MRLFFFLLFYIFVPAILIKIVLMKKKLILMLLTAATVCVNVSCGKKPSANTSSEEPEKVEETQDTQVRDLLRQDAEISSKMLVGSKVDFMTRVTSFTFEDDAMVIDYVIDEEYCTIKDMKSKRQLIKENLQITLENTPGTVALISRLKQIHGRMIYNYVGDESKEVMTITFQY